MVRSTITLLTLLITVSIAWSQTTHLYSLRAALKAAKSNNPDLKWQEQDIHASLADVTTSAVRPNPIFNTQLLHVANQKYWANETSWSNPANTQYWFQVTKPMQVAGMRKNKIGVAENQYTQSQLDYNEQARNIYLQIAMKWLDVWAASIRLNILNEGKQNIDSLVQINSYRLKDKVITETDLARTQLLQKQYQRDIITARQVLQNENQNLRYLLGATDSTTIDLNDNSFNNMNKTGDSLVLIGTRERTDILAAKNSYEGSLLNISLQKSMAYPMPELGGMYNPQNKTPYLGFYGTVAIPIFNRNQGQREKAEVLKEQSQRYLEASEKRAETEVLTAYRAYQTQKQNLLDYEDNLTKAESILSSVRYSYLKGATSVVDFLEAQRTWLDTQLRYYQTMEDYRRSYIQLLYATGMINDLAD